MILGGYPSELWYLWLSNWKGIGSVKIPSSAVADTRNFTYEYLCNLEWLWNKGPVKQKPCVWGWFLEHFSYDIIHTTCLPVTSFQWQTGLHVRLSASYEKGPSAWRLDDQKSGPLIVRVMAILLSLIPKNLYSHDLEKRKSGRWSCYILATPPDVFL